MKKRASSLKKLPPPWHTHCTHTHTHTHHTHTHPHTHPPTHPPTNTNILHSPHPGSQQEGKGGIRSSRSERSIRPGQKPIQINTQFKYGTNNNSGLGTLSIYLKCGLRV